MPKLKAIENFGEFVHGDFLQHGLEPAMATAKLVGFAKSCLMEHSFYKLKRGQKKNITIEDLVHVSLHKNHVGQMSIIVYPIDM